MLALRTAIQPTASVIREGREREVPAEEVVPGDLLVLREGDRVAADGRVAAHERLELDESALTGESLPVPKTCAPVAHETAMADRSSMVFAGTGVTLWTWARDRRRHRARDRDRADRRAHAPTRSRRRRRCSGVSDGSRARWSRSASRSRSLLTLGMLARGASLEEAFLVGVSVAVAAVPEGLAATVTIALAQGARAMAGQRRDRPPPRRGRDARRRHGDRGGQDRHADDQPASGRGRQAGAGPNRVEPSSRRGVLASTADLVDDERRDPGRGRPGRRRVPAGARGGRRRGPARRTAARSLHACRSTRGGSG